MRRRPRVHHSGASAPGARLRLSPEESHHLARVLRARVGDALWVFDGKGREWAARVVGIDRQGVEVSLEQAREDPVECALRVVLYASLCSPERTDWLVQKSVEIGVAALRFVPARRGAVRRPSAARLERWRRIALEACKQCGRRLLPEVSLVEDWPEKSPGARAFWCTAQPAAPPLGRRLREESGPEEVWVAIGPEGGFTAEEARHFEATGWEAVSLGPRILRVETAALVACALVLHAWGDLGRGG